MSDSLELLVAVEAWDAVIIRLLKRRKSLEKQEEAVRYCSWLLIVGSRAKNKGLE